MKLRNILLLTVIIIACAVLTILLSKKRSDNLSNGNDIGGNNQMNIEIDNNDNFDFKIIKQTHKKYQENYMISPLSIAYALTMLKEGARENTLYQIENALNNYQLHDAYEVKNRVSIANLTFINNRYKDQISQNYIDLLKTSYKSDVMFDDFSSVTNINKWFENKTYGMIPNTLDEIDPETKIGLGNAIAIDLEWKYKLDCTNTLERTFTKNDKTIIKTAMMNDTDGVSYIESKNAKGIIKDYALYDKSTGEKIYENNNNSIALEFIAIRPEVSIDDYMKIFNKTELDYLLNTRKQPSDNLEIHYSIPKYKYEFNYKTFKDSLIDLGISDVFISGKANLKNIVAEDSDMELYVDKAVHKSFIEVNEEGTKAAAVTAFMMMDTAMYEEPKKSINIEFDKPFIYIIKEKNNNNIWFFGTVYEPMKWEDNPKCEIM